MGWGERTWDEMGLEEIVWYDMRWDDMRWGYWDEMTWDGMRWRGEINQQKRKTKGKKKGFKTKYKEGRQGHGFSSAYDGMKMQ